MQGKERNQQVDKKKIYAIFNCKTDYWSLGVTLYIMDNEVRMSHQQLQPVYQWAVPRRINWQLKDKGMSKFVETSACSDLFKAFWGNTCTCFKFSVNNDMNVYGDV